MHMETVPLSRIVLAFTPELEPFLRQDELDLMIVLRDGIEHLRARDAVEIIQQSIYEQQKDALLH